MFPIDPASGRPIYQQIAALLREQIFRRELQPGDKLPSRTGLARQFNCAEETVRAALDVLKHEGLVMSRHGLGNYVRDAPLIHRHGSWRYLRDHRPMGSRPFQAEAEREGQRAEQRVLSVERVRPPADVASRLGTDEDEEVLVRRHLLLADDKRVSTVDSYYHPRVPSAGTALEKVERIEEGVENYLIDTLHLQLYYFTEELRARNPTAAESAMLHLRDGEPIIYLLRTMFNTDGRPVQVSDQRLAGDKYVLLYDVPAN